MFNDVAELEILFEREDLTALQAFAKERCMPLSTWARNVILHLAAKQGAQLKSRDKS